ncbi:hypothetical protein [Bradyrhizobium sp. CCBAU 051011]|uniref:hypothetical protein n=1 Tax=Bradyrhizobium sp. CCBAU 051011 TaxID=858422 RepID=UPI001379E23E|nr:hypothetical protein [Bradyrhizobium sp. CCBAU 051011]
MKLDVPYYNLAELSVGEAVATSGGRVFGLFAAGMFAAVAAWEMGVDRLVR